MRSLLLGLTALALVLVGCGSSLPSAEEAGGEGVYTVTVDQAAERYEEVEGLVVLDVRTQAEYDRGHVPGAVLLDFYADDFEDSIAELDRDVPYLVYCAQGGRSGSTGGLMGELGFADVADLSAGFPGWADAGLPVEG